MSIKHKIASLTTLWLIGILFIFNIIVYVSFLRITTDNEAELLEDRAQKLIEKTGGDQLIKGASTDLLQDYLPDYGLIRIVNPEGQVVQQLQADEQITQVETTTVKVMKRKLYKLGGQPILMVRLPILAGNLQIGTLEMAEKLDTLQENIRILISILSLSALGAIALSLIGGVLLSGFILRPISGMVSTMETIEQSLVFRKIPIDPGAKDELKAMASTFNRMMDRIEDSFIRQKQFVSDASHELKTPLTVIEGYASMLLRWGLKDEHNAREAVESIHAEAVRMKQMTQQLLDLASTENERKLAMEKIEMVSFCEEIAAPLRKLYHRMIPVQSAAQELYLMANPIQIKQLLLILLDNALKYSKRKIEILLAEINDPASEHSGVEIRVKDQGIGIAEKDLERVFERFYRADPSRHRETGGAGLGLSIARNIVWALHGTIEMESKENVGTEVIVFIPSH